MTTKTIGAKLKNLSKKFPLKNSAQFLYKEKSDLSRKYSTVYVYAIIFDDERGHSLFIWNPHRRGKDWQWQGWNKWLLQKGYDILTGAVMDAINDKHGSAWIVKNIVGFHGAIYEPVYKACSEKRNKTHDKGQH